MGVSGYYISAPPVINFPFGDREGSSPLDIERTDILHETEKGKRWVYEQFDRRCWTLIYRATLAELAFFQTLDAAADGQRNTFYFIPDVDQFNTSGDAVLVRKEKDFKPKEIGICVDDNGNETLLYEYTLMLTEEPAGPDVQA